MFNLTKCIAFRRALNNFKNIESSYTYNARDTLNICNKLKIYKYSHNNDIYSIKDMDSSSFNTYVKNYYFVGYN